MLYGKLLRSLHVPAVHGLMGSPDSGGMRTSVLPQYAETPGRPREDVPLM